MSQNDLGRGGIIIGCQQPQRQATQRGISDQGLKVGSQLEARAARRGRQAAGCVFCRVYPDSEPCLAARRWPSVRRGQAPAREPARSRSGRDATPVRQRPPANLRAWARCLRPRNASRVPVRRSRQAAFVGRLEQGHDRRQSGRRDRPRPPAAPHIGARLESCCASPGSEHALRSTAHQRLDSIPDHQAQRSVSGILVVAGERLGQSPNAGQPECAASAEARLSLTFGLGSVLASSANRFIVAPPPVLCRRTAGGSPRRECARSGSSSSRCSRSSSRPPVA